MRSQGYLIINKTIEEVLQTWSELTKNQVDLKKYFEFKQLKRFEDLSRAYSADYAFWKGEGFYLYSPVTGRYYDNKLSRSFDKYIKKTRKFTLLDNYGKRDLGEEYKGEEIGDTMNSFWINAETGEKTIKGRKETISISELVHILFVDNFDIFTVET